MARIAPVIALFLALHSAAQQSASAAQSVPERQMIETVNRERIQLGLGMLSEDQGLSGLAAQRSEDMAVRHYFSHTTPEGLTVFDLMTQRGLSYGVASENLAYSTDSQPTGVGPAIQNLLSSPPHRANLLNPAFTVVGLGVAGGEGGTYFTVLLGG